MEEDEEPGPAKSKKAMERPAKKARKSGTKVGLHQLGFCFGSQLLLVKTFDGCKDRRRCDDHTPLAERRRDLRLSDLLEPYPRKRELPRESFDRYK